MALYDTEAFTLTALADYTAQGHRTELDSSEAVVCEEEGTGAVCESLGGAFPFGFNTAWRSSRTGLYAMRHRWYSPTLGEFLSHDPLEEVDSFNLYAFAAHDPINSWDPYGLRSRSNAPEPIGNLIRDREPGGSPGPGGSLWGRPSLHPNGMPTPGGWGNGGEYEPQMNQTPMGEAVVFGNIFAGELDSEIQMRYQQLEAAQAECRWVGCRAVYEVALFVMVRDKEELYQDMAMMPAGGPGLRFGKRFGARMPGWLERATVRVKGWKVWEKGKGARKWIGDRVEKGRERWHAWRNPCGSNSFEGATLVLRCDDTQSPIEELEEGDWVWARDVLTGQESCEQVTETFVHEDDQLLALTLRSELSGEYERLVVTHDHPMLSPAGEEVAAYALKLDQRLGGLYDDFVVVTLEPLELVLPVHNLSVQHAHTFFVGQGAVWAHNCYDDLKSAGRLGDMGKDEFERLSGKWSSASFDSLEDSLMYHANKHHDGDVAKMLRRSSGFNKRGAKKTDLGGGAVRWNKKNGEFLIEKQGKTVSHGYNKD